MSADIARTTKHVTKATATARQHHVKKAGRASKARQNATNQSVLGTKAARLASVSHQTTAFAVPKALRSSVKRSNELSMAKNTLESTASASEWTESKVLASLCSSCSFPSASVAVLSACETRTRAKSTS